MESRAPCKACGSCTPRVTQLHTAGNTMLLRVARPIGRRALATKRVVLQRPAEAGSAYERFEHNDSTWSATKHNESRPWRKPLAPFLPAGYPQSVKDGYGTYALLQFAGFACSSAGGVLSTRVLLTAVGVGDASAAPLAAAANWAVKDGLGMLGGVAFASIWSGRFGRETKKVAPCGPPWLWMRLRLVELAAFTSLPPVLRAHCRSGECGQEHLIFGRLRVQSRDPSRVIKQAGRRQSWATLTAKSGSQTIVASLVGLGLGVAACRYCVRWRRDDRVAGLGGAVEATHLTCTWLSLRYVADVELDPPRLAALVDAFLEAGTCPTPAELLRRINVFVGGGDPSWLSVGDRVDAFPSDAFWGSCHCYVLHAERGRRAGCYCTTTRRRDALEAAGPRARAARGYRRSGSRRGLRLRRVGRGGAWTSSALGVRPGAAAAGGAGGEGGVGRCCCS